MAFLPVKQNFPIWKGATFHYRFQWLMDTGTATKPEDVSGFTASCPLKSLDGQTTYLTLTTENGGIVFEGTSGNVNIIIPAGTTGAITWPQAIYELLVLNPNTGETLPLMTGRFIPRAAL